MPASNFRKLSGLKVSNPMFFPVPTIDYYLIGEYSLLAWLIGNKTRLGAVSHGRSGYCSDIANLRLCVRSEKSRKHEVALYFRLRAKHKSFFHKKFDFSVEGELSDTDALDIAIQGTVEITREEFLGETKFSLDLQKKVANLIERGAVLSGLVRVAGKRIRGKSVVRPVEIATITILGIAGAAILFGLVLVPIPMIILYRKGIVTDVETSYKRAVMKNDGVDTFMEVPSKAPSICAEAIDSGNIASINHAFEMYS